MNKSLMLSAVLLLATFHAQAAKKDCNELKSEIEARLNTKGVKSFMLDIVDAGKEADAKVVGSCEGGAKKIVYRKN